MAKDSRTSSSLCAVTTFLRPARRRNGQNVSHRVDTAADGHAIVGIYADYQFTLPPAQLPSQVVLLLELGEKQVNVRAFNTTTNQELGAPWYPFALP